MPAVTNIEGYTEEQIRRARRLIGILMEVPEEKQMLFTAVTNAYIDGVETGMRIDGEVKGVTV